jgi:hypothetical protein
MLALLASPQLHSGDPAVVDGLSVIGFEVDSDVVDISTGVSVIGVKLDPTPAPSSAQAEG